MKNQYIKFGLRLALLSLPIVAILLLYIITDPFRVIYNYDYSKPANTAVGLNKDYVSTETFVYNNPNNHYDSFIFGASPSFFYKVENWKKYINSTHCFHFDASSESLYGINRKVSLIDKKGVTIKNALFILDHKILAKITNSSGHLFIKDPVLSGGKLAFHFEFISTFFDYNFLFPYIDLLLSKKVKPYMKKNNLFSDEHLEGNYICNEIAFSDFDSLVGKKAYQYYTPERMKSFYKRPLNEAYSLPVIGKEQITLLNQMEEIFKKDKTAYKIIVSPLFDQEKLNPADLSILKQIFGERNVFDFSGKNNWTDDFHNYYDHNHYRAYIADSILKRIYTVN